jgi:exodeoxyribonuclease X
MKVIRCLDCETTGTDPEKDRVVEVAWCDIEIVEGRPDHLREYEVIDGGQSLINPGITIPVVASAIHHIVDEDVKDEKSWEDFLAWYPTGSDARERTIVAYAAHNLKFERGFCGDLIGATPAICTYKAAVRLWPDAPSHSNQALRYLLNPAGLRRAAAMPPHRAFPDAYVTAFLVREALRGASFAELTLWANEPVLLRKFRFGKHAGKPLAEVPSDYLDWMLGQDFGEDEAFTAKSELARRRGELATA